MYSYGITTESMNSTMIIPNNPFSMKILVVAINTIIGYHRGTELLGALPVFSAWEKCSTDLCFALLSCYAVIYARESGGRLTRFLSTRYWRPIRAAQQTTYLFHAPIILAIIGAYLPEIYTITTIMVTALIYLINELSYSSGPFAAN
ncbi:unnamed protein product, partial [Medioppia subpectinata]